MLPQRVLLVGPIREESRQLIEKGPLESVHFILPTHYTLPKLSLESASVSYEHQQVAKEAGENWLYQYSVPEFNATEPATGLFSIYPGLTKYSECVVNCVDTDYIKNKVFEGQVNCLMVEQVEVGFSILEKLCAEKALESLDTICIRAMTVPPYRATKGLKEIEDLLIEYNFFRDQSEVLDPDFPLVICKKNPLADELKEANKKNIFLEKNLATMNSQLDHYKTQCQVLEDKLEDCVKQLHEYQEAKTITSEQYRALKKSEKELRNALEVSETQLSLLRSLLVHTD